MTTRLDNACCKNVEKGKINVEWELGRSSWGRMNLGLEHGKQEERVIHFK